MSTHVMVEVPSAAFEGPRETAYLFRDAANAVVRGLPIEGSSVQEAVAGLLRAAADALDAGPLAGAERSVCAVDGPIAPWLIVLDGGAEAPLFYIVQCSVCPQRAALTAQPVDGWVCPRCAEVAERAPVRLPAEFDTPSGLAALLRHHGVRVEFDDDEYPLGKVRG